MSLGVSFAIQQDAKRHVYLISFKILISLPCTLHDVHDFA